MGATVRKVLADGTIGDILARAKSAVTRSAADVGGLPRLIALLVLYAEAHHQRQIRP